MGWRPTTLNDSGPLPGCRSCLPCRLGYTPDMDARTPKPRRDDGAERADEILKVIQDMKRTNRPYAGLLCF
jgi:hypothetical protein